MTLTKEQEDRVRQIIDEVLNPAIEPEIFTTTTLEIDRRASISKTDFNHIWITERDGDIEHDYDNESWIAQLDSENPEWHDTNEENRPHLVALVKEARKRGWFNHVKTNN